LAVDCYGTLHRSAHGPSRRFYRGFKSCAKRREGGHPCPPKVWTRARCAALPSRQAEIRTLTRIYRPVAIRASAKRNFRIKTRAPRVGAQGASEAAVFLIPPERATPCDGPCRRRLPERNFGRCSNSSSHHIQSQSVAAECIAYDPSAINPTRVASGSHLNLDATRVGVGGVFSVSQGSPTMSGYLGL